MKKSYELLVKASNAIFHVEKWLLVVAVVVAVAVNFVNVCLRYLAGRGLSYCETLSICLFMFMVVIGGNIAVKTDSEIRIDVFKFKTPKADARFRLITDVIAIVAIVLCVVGLFATVKVVMANRQRVTPLPIYTYHIYIIMTIGFFMILLDRIIVLLRHILIASGKEVTEEARTI